MKIKIILAILLVILLSLGTILPLFKNGFFEFHDNTQVARVYEMGIMLLETFPVRWVPDLGYSYGYPIFNFYGPLPYYVGGLFTIFGFTALTATKIMLGIGVLVAGITMFFFSKKFFGIKAGLVSAIIYMYFPYHAVNIYVRGAVGELFAYAFLPLLFLGIYSLLELKKIDIKKLKLIPILLVAFGVFLVATSHNLSIFMFVVLLVPLVLISFILALSKKTFFMLLSASILLGILLSSFYIVPAVFEMKYTNVASQIGGGADFRDHFICISQYWNSAWGFGGSTAGCVDGLSFKLSKLNIFLVLFSVVLVVISLYRKKFMLQEKVILISLILLIISVFLTLSGSAFIWNLRYMEFIQYPWRFTNFIGLFGAFIIGYILYFFEKKINHTGIIITVLIIGATLYLNAKLFVPQRYTNFPNEHYTSKQQLIFNVSKISDEYMPPGFIVPKNENEIPTVKAETLNAFGDFKVVSKDPLELKMDYDLLSDGVVHINTAYFPAWKAYLNEQPIPINISPKGMNISVQAGEGSLTLRFEQTFIEKVSNLISMLAFIAILAVIIRTSLAQKKNKR